MIRVCACFMVILLHAAAGYWYEFSPRWNAANFYDSFTRSCVPLFMMMSGALLTRKAASEPLPVFLKKRVCRILCPLLFWSFLSSAAYIIVKGKPFLHIAIKMITTSGFYHLWYLYALVGLYPLLPIVGKWYCNTDRSCLKFYIYVWVAVCAVMSAQDILNLFSSKAANIISLYNLSEFTSYIGYFVLGAYLFESKSQRSKRKICFAGILTFIISGALIVGCTYFLSHYLNEPSGVFYNYRSPLVIISSASLFTALLSCTISDKYKFIVTFLSDNSFGIYCIHAFILFIMAKIKFMFCENIWLNIPITAIFVFCISLILTVIMRKIPYLHKAV
ncbi:MAG: acyltransferase family protein [Synergistes sp.]|nr:acyltransferase family protein [Synergistes sp.]